jgi:uncharacterized protein with FMN-binding domain
MKQRIPLLVILLTVCAAVLCTAACSGKTASPSGAPSGAASVGGLYTPGVYEGTGEGYEGPITVAVRVDETKIVRIEVMEHEETPGFSTAAFEELIGAIIATNSTEVDALSGASETSGGFLEAVENALEKARK